MEEETVEEHQIVVILMKRPGIILARLSFEPSDWSCEAIVSFTKWRQERILFRINKLKLPSHFPDN